MIGNDFIAVRPSLVKFLGGKLVHAAVLERVHFRCQSGRHSVEDDDGAWWPCSHADLAADTGLSVHTVRSSLAALVSAGHLEVREHGLSRPGDRTKSYRVATIVDSRSWGTPDVDFRTPQMGKSTSGTSSIEEIKTQEEVSDSDFDSWYAKYPRRDAKGQARKAFHAARKKVDLSTLERGRDLYAAKVKLDETERRYIKLPSTWLNGECWDDDYGDVKITGSGFDAWWDQVVADVDVAEVGRTLGLMWSLPDVPDGVNRAEFLAEDRRSWITNVRSEAEARWASQFGSAIAGP